MACIETDGGWVKVINSKIRIALLSLAGFLFAPLATSHAAYSLISLTDSSGPGATVRHVGLNNSGNVVIDWVLDTGSESIDIYGQNARNIAFGGPQAQTPFFNVSDPSINNLGQLSFFGVPYPDKPTLVQLLRDTAGVEIPVQSFSSTDTIGNATSINNSGVIAYRANVGGTGSKIFRSDGSIIAQVGTNGFTSFLDPVINKNGQVAFHAVRNSLTGIYLGDGTNILTVADSSSVISNVFSNPAINDNGQVVFSATLTAGGKAVYIGDGTTLAPLVDTNGAFNDFSWTSINNSGQVAFVGFPDAGQAGIYITSIGGTPERVVGVGDSLFGSTVTSAFFYTDGLNDSG
jgi:hypothetical protein